MGPVWDPADWWYSAECPSWCLDQLSLRPLQLPASDKTLQGQIPVNSSHWGKTDIIVNFSSGSCRNVEPATKFNAQLEIFSLRLHLPDTPGGEQDGRWWWGSSSLNQRWWPPLRFQTARRPGNNTAEAGNIGSTLHSLDKCQKDGHCLQSSCINI